MATRRRHGRPKLRGNALTLRPRLDAEQAAYQLLLAIQWKWPHQYGELDQAVRDWLEDHADRFNPFEENDEFFDPTGEPEFQDLVHEWTARYKLSCVAMDFVATKVAAGESLSPLVAKYFRIDERGERHVLYDFGKLPTIRIDPFERSQDELLEDVAALYAQTRQHFANLGFKPRPRKREREHFAYLAAHLVGGLSYAEIAARHEELGLPAKSEKRIANIAREVADRIGIPMPTTPGPRPGSHRIFRR